MSIFRYRSRDAGGRRASGHVEAAGEEQALRFLEKGGHRDVVLKPTRPSGDTGARFGFILFFAVIGFFLVAVTVLHLRVWEDYRRLRDEGRTVTGRVTRSWVEKTQRDELTHYEYAFTDGSGTLRTGQIMASGGISTARGRMSVRDFGTTPVPGQTVTVTYDPLDPSLHLPVVVTSPRVRAILAGMFRMQALLVAVLAFLSVMYVLHRRGRRRTGATVSGRPDAGRDRLPGEAETGAAAEEGGEPGFVERFTGIPVIEDPPRPETVLEDGRPRTRTRVGYIRRIGGRSQFLGLLGTLAYYACAVSYWLIFPGVFPSVRLAGGATGPGDVFPEALAAAAGFSLLVVPALLVAYAFHVRARKMVLTAAVTVLAHFLLISAGGVQGAPQRAFAASPGAVLLGWVLPAAVMIAVLHSRRLVRRLDLEKPIYEED
ncbi:MAG: hypothetical protein KA419_03685 [Acidobacteria bacterium]|nr:hypothetical protein [Acidobacteriota bacterium]